MMFALLSSRWQYLIIPGAVLLMACPLSLACINTADSPPDQPAAINSVNNSQPDSLKQLFIQSYHKYRLDKQLEDAGWKWFNGADRLFYNLNSSELVNNEFVDVSRDLYSRYYLNKIELYNFRDYAYLYLDIRQAQNNQGALQIKVPLPNFYRMFDSNKRQKD